MKVTNETETKLIEYYLAPHTLQDTAFTILGHKCTKAASMILAKHNIAKHDKAVIDLLREKTNLIKFGVNNPSASSGVKEKRQQTVRERYNVDNVFQSQTIKDQIKQTCLEKYGSTHYNKTTESKEKHKTTCLARYGVDHYNKTAEGKHKYSQTCINRYGVSSYTQTTTYKDTVREKQNRTTEKQLATKRKNNTFASSSAEKRYLKALQNTFGTEDVIMQYQESRYPFLCDFYIKSKDLFIELNFIWTHGGKLFTGSPEDLEKLALWRQKAQFSKCYQNAINTWTIKDLNKYKKAHENNLNYLVFYTQKDLEAWLAKVKLFVDDMSQTV